MQQVPTTSSQKIRSHRNFRRILSGLCMPFQKKRALVDAFGGGSMVMHYWHAAAESANLLHNVDAHLKCRIPPYTSESLADVAQNDARGAVRSTLYLGAAHPWQSANAIAAYREEIQSITRTIASIDVRRPVCSATVDITVTAFKY
jgi:hypothetical protein